MRAPKARDGLKPAAEVASGFPASYNVVDFVKDQRWAQAECRELFERLIGRGCTAYPIAIAMAYESLDQIAKAYGAEEVKAFSCLLAKYTSRTIAAQTLDP